MLGGFTLKMCIYSHSRALTKGYGSRQQISKILRASPSAGTSTHPRGLLGRSVNRQHRSHIIFECGCYCPSNRFFGPAAPWYYSSAGVIVPRIDSLGQQRLGIIRVRASVPQIILFGPAASLRYSIAGFGPSNHFLRASSTLVLFEYGLRSLELFSSGQQRLYII
jgi:hypothetical protein